MENLQVGDWMSQKLCERKRTKNSVSIAAYPQNNIKEIAKIMSEASLDYIPVFFSPWNKTLVGFVELSKIQPILES